MNDIQRALSRLVNEAVRKARQETSTMRMTHITGGPAVPTTGGIGNVTSLIWGIDAWGASLKTWG